MTNNSQSRSIGFEGGTQTHLPKTKTVGIRSVRRLCFGISKARGVDLEAGVNSNGSTSTNYSSDPDVRLMLEVRNDNAAAFEQLVARYQDRVLSLLENLVRSREQAEDLAQETFLRVFRARKTYEPGAKFATWLFTIATNVANNAIRSRIRNKEVALSATGPTDSTTVPVNEIQLMPSGHLPARKLDKLEMAEVVRVAIDALPERQRVALLLSKFEHMGYQDISEVLGLNTNAVKSLLSRARVNLKQVLAPYVEEGAKPDRPSLVEE